MCGNGLSETREFSAQLMLAARPRYVRSREYHVICSARSQLARLPKWVTLR